MAKKPKAFRAHFYNGVHYHPSDRLPANALVIPDGATVPLPASVRRVMRAARKLIAVAKGNGIELLSYRESHPQAYALYKAVESYERATKAKGRG